VEILSIVLMVIGAFFLAVSAVGLLRLPDFYSRNHAIGKSETLGAMLILVGLAILNGWDLNTIKIIFVIIFVVIANPTATHAITRAALRSDLELWTRKDKERTKK